MEETPSVRLAKICDISAITAKNGLVKVQKINDMLVILKEKVLTYPVSYALKSCNEFLLLVCKVVENYVLKSDKLDKKKVVLDLYRQLFPLSEPEIKLIDLGVEFLHSNNMISVVKKTKKVASFLKKKLKSVGL